MAELEADIALKEKAWIHDSSRCTEVKNIFLQLMYPFCTPWCRILPCQMVKYDMSV